MEEDVNAPLAFEVNIIFLPSPVIVRLETEGVDVGAINPLLRISKSPEVVEAIPGIFNPRLVS